MKAAMSSDGNVLTWKNSHSCGNVDMWTRGWEGACLVTLRPITGAAEAESPSRREGPASHATAESDDPQRPPRLQSHEQAIE